MFFYNFRNIIKYRQQKNIEKQNLYLSKKSIDNYKFFSGIKKGGLFYTSLTK